MGSFFLSSEIEWVLFCDVDELFEKEKLGHFLSTFALSSYTAIRFATYWYFRSASLRAKEQPNGPLLIRRSALHPELLLHPDERCGIFHKVPGKKEQEVKDTKGAPLVHHYSWVRQEQELRHKVKTWGHHWERNWQKLIDEELKGAFSGTDFVRGYTYEKVEPYFDPLLEPIPEIAEKKRQVHQVTAQELFRLEIKSLLNQP